MLKIKTAAVQPSPPVPLESQTTKQTSLDLRRDKFESGLKTNKVAKMPLLNVHRNDTNSLFMSSNSDESDLNKSNRRHEDSIVRDIKK